MEAARLARARVRPARTPADVSRAAAFLEAPIVETIATSHPEERGAVRLCEVDGELVAALVIDPRPLRLRDVDVACARLVDTPGEDGRPHFRRTGDRDLFVFLLEEALGYIWMKRYPIAFAHGELALYPAHGFVPCFHHPRVYVDVAAALAQPAVYRVRHLKTDDAHRIPALRAHDRKSRPVVFATGVPPFHHFCVEGPGRVLKGYLGLEANGRSTWLPKLFVAEVDVEDRAAARTVLRHCAEKARELGLETMHFPVGPGHPLASLCLELGGHVVIKGAASDPFLNEEMIHLVDPPLLVAALAPWFERRLAGRRLEATVPLATGSGTWELRIAGGAVECRELARRPKGCVEIPHWQLTQLLAGYRGADELDPAPARPHAEALETLLPKTWPYSLPDPDVWETVERPEPYAAAAAAVVERTVVPWRRGPA